MNSDVLKKLNTETGEFEPIKFLEIKTGDIFQKYTNGVPSQPWQAKGEPYIDNGALVINAHKYIEEVK